MELRKLFSSAAAVLAVLSMSPVYADDCGSCEPVCDPCCPSLDYCDSCDDWTFYGDWLYWRARKCGLDYALPAEDSDNFIGKVYGPCLDYDSGYRLGFVLGCEGMDLGVRYTSYNTDAFSSNTDANGNMAASLVGENHLNVTNHEFQYASGKYALDLDVFDLEASYGMEVTDELNAGLYAGFRYATLDQSFNVLYAQDSNDLNGDASPIDKLKLTNDMNSYGLYFGLNAGYLFCECFEFFFDFSHGVHVAEFDRSYVYKTDLGEDEEEEALPLVTEVNLKDECWRLVNTCDLALGLKYNLCNFLCADWDFSLGYEFHHWYNTSDFLYFVSGDTSGEAHLDHGVDSVGFDGLFVRLGATF